MIAAKATFALKPGVWFLWSSLPFGRGQVCSRSSDLCETLTNERSLDPMALVYKLVGYDRKTERQSVKFDIPAKHAAFAKTVVGLNPHRDVIGDQPLTEMQARDIGRVIGCPIDTAHSDFFLEPYNQPQQRRFA